MATRQWGGNVSKSFGFRPVATAMAPPPARPARNFCSGATPNLKEGRFTRLINYLANFIPLPLVALGGIVYGYYDNKEDSDMEDFPNLRHNGGNGSGRE